MNEDEKFVRENWKSIDVDRDEIDGSIVIDADIMPLKEEDPFITLCAGDEPEVAWSAAAEFTRERLEQVQQVQEEITWVQEEIEITEIAIKLEPHIARSRRLAMKQRVLIREQDTLAELKRGMK